MEQINVQELPALIGQLLAQGLRPVLLDVREPWEIAHAGLRIDGTDFMAIPMQQIPARLAELDPQQPVLALCHHGMRSQQVALFLSRQGYPHTYNIVGGIDAWSLQMDAGIARY
jgi:rhodanese-related sulfurtransferase